jgi:hypothetical protein
MERHRATILQLLALGRIDAAQAERLIAAASAERETAWAMAGCAAIVGLAQLRWLAPEFAHVFRAMLAGAVPVLHHALNTFAMLFGGLS